MIRYRALRPVCGELLIFDTNQQFATHRIMEIKSLKRTKKIMAHLLSTSAI
jgi:hypothetical protein